MSFTKSSFALASFSILVSSNVGAKPVDSLDGFFVKGGYVVKPQDYPTVETSRQMLKNQDDAGVNKFLHKRELTPTDKQTVVRMNRDTFYSFALVDVSEGASITIPEVPEGKYVSVQPVTEDHRIQPMFYGSGTFELKTHTGTHLYLIIRLDSTLSKEEVRGLQNSMSISANSSDKFEAEAVDKASFDKVEEELKAKMPAIYERDGVDALVGMFTAPTDASNQFFSEEKYEVGAAIGWGGAQLIDNIYEVSGNYPSKVCHQATFEDPMDKAFWSFTVYNKQGFMFSDQASVNSNSAKPNDDGTYTVSFGCAKDAPNNIATKNRSGVFTLGVRHYQPGDKVQQGYRLLPLVEAVK